LEGNVVDVHRAKQIMNAEQHIDVTFEGESVWIDQVDDTLNKALVHSLKTGKSMEVPLNRLHEPQ
jgi:H-type small acid-soluble spore protein